MESTMTTMAMPRGDQGEVYQCCGNCRFMQQGKCKYDPPPQPAVAESDWCGHWQMCEIPCMVPPDNDSDDPGAK